MDPSPEPRDPPPTRHQIEAAAAAATRRQLNHPSAEPPMHNSTSSPPPAHHVIQADAARPPTRRWRLLKQTIFDLISLKCPFLSCMWEPRNIVCNHTQRITVLFCIIICNMVLCALCTGTGQSVILQAINAGAESSLLVFPQSFIFSCLFRNMRLNRGKSRLSWLCRFHFSSLFMRSTIIAACFCVASSVPTAAPVSSFSVQVDPWTGDDSTCNKTFICKTIAHAVQLVGVSHVNLSAGVFNESTVSINNIVSLFVTGVPSSTFFDCSLRLSPFSGPVFIINNSTVTIVGVTFQHCSNTIRSGGAVSAVGSSVAVSHCSFTNCTAANGGAISATGCDSGCFLNIQNSNFSSNSAVGGLIGCPASTQSSEPCSTWGGAVAAFEMSNVSVTGCIMVNNSAVAVVPNDSAQIEFSRNAVAGGGCLSVLFRGNSSASTLYIVGNSFSRCGVDVSRSRNVDVGNGILHPSLVLFHSSVYFILKFHLLLQDTAAHCRFCLACLLEFNYSASHLSNSPSKKMCSQIA
jgi:hypothetical protein